MLNGTEKSNGQKEVQSPVFGVLGQTTGDDSRVDLISENFDSLVEFHGKRCAWTKAARCPCAPLDRQLDQPDINCPLCHGLAWLYYGDSKSQSLPDQTLTAAQRYYIRRHDAFVIRGVISGFTKEDKPWDAQVGAWRSGMASISVRSANLLGFQDRIAVLDDRITFSEVILAPTDPAAPLALRYPVAGGVNLLRTEERVLRAGQDFSVRDGQVWLLAARTVQPGTRIAIHYVTFPTYLVQSLPQVSRETSQENLGGRPQTGIGRSTQLPVRAVLRLEFLTGQGV